MNILNRAKRSFTRILLITCFSLLCALTQAQSIRISEVVADNEDSLLDMDGDTPDWVELYNPTDNAISLDGWYLTDVATNLTKWSFPATNIAAKSFMIVFASDKDRSVAGEELHTNFKLSAKGEYIALVQANGSIIEDAHTFPALEEDASFGYTFENTGTDILLDAGTSCSAHVPTNATDSADWNGTSFNDSLWLQGTTGVGYERNSGYENLINLDVESTMYNVSASVYIRIPFTLSDAVSVSDLQLKMKYDDAFVAYLNGTQIISSAYAALPPAWNSKATAYGSDANSKLFETFDLSAHIGLLTSGTNVLALHGMNYHIRNSDLLFIPRLEATYVGNITPDSAGYLDRATPGYANAETYYEDFVETPVTAPARGFYNAPLQVSVSNVTLGATIRYTTDGSEPTESSAEYIGPVTISNTTCFRVGAFIEGWKPSFPRTDTYIFVDDVVAQPEYEENIVGDNATSSSGQWMVYGMNQEVVNKTYTDASNQVVTVQDSLKAIPTLSIVTDDSNLFDPAAGIYVNAAIRLEVPASAELINPDGSEGFHINAGLRIRGGWSRHDGYCKHSFRLFFRSEYGAGKLNYPLFDNEGADQFDKVDLRTAQNYNWAHADDIQNNFLRDVFARDTALAMGQENPRSRYYHLYVNGQYWGLYMTEERPVAAFGESYYGGDADDYDAVKVQSWTDGNREIEATDGTLDAYERLYNAAMAGFTNNIDYFAVQGMNETGESDPGNEKLLDVDNMIDYLLVIYYTAASDNCITSFAGGYQKLNNMFAIYNRANPDGFKWFQHDSEHALDTNKNPDFTGPFTHENFKLLKYFNAMTLHDKLVVNEEYRLQFADRIYKHMYDDGALVRTNCEARLDDRAVQIDRAIIANAARWGGPVYDDETGEVSMFLDRDTWVDAVATTRVFFARSGDRCDEVLTYLKNDGLIPSILPPLFNLNGGQVPAGTRISLTMQEDEFELFSSPFYGTPLAVPGTIEVEEYDLGGGGIAYYDSHTSNRGGEYRPAEGVDIEACDEGGYSIGWTETDEWLKYTVDVATAGDYALSIRAAKDNNDTALCHIEIDDIDVTGPIVIEDTGDSQVWADTTVNIGLTNGVQVVKLVIDKKAFNINRMVFTQLHTDLLPVSAQPSVPEFQKTMYVTTDGTDPRAIGGAIAGSAYSGPIAITRPTHLKARCRTSNGEWSALAEATFITPESPLAVTELMYHAPDGNAYDFIEVKNVSDETVTLKGYKLDDAIDFKFKNAEQADLASGDYLVVVDDIDAFNTIYPSNTIAIAGEFSGDFSNGGEGVDLEFRDNDLVSFTYDDARDWPQAADGAGHSLVPLEMDDQETGSLDYGGNWRASSYLGGSPGTADPDPSTAVVLNEISAHTDTGLAPPYDSNDKIELYNTSSSPIMISGWTLSDSLDTPNKWLIPDTTLPANGFVVFDETDFHIDDTNGFGLNKAGEQVVLSAPDRIVDSVRFKGQENEDTGVTWGRYPDGNGTWLTTAPTLGSENEPVAATLQICELMYHPEQAGNEYEYIQIKNIGTATQTFDNETGAYRIDGGVAFTFPAGTTLPVGETLWILSFNPTNTVKLNPFCATYGLTAADETMLGGYSGSLSDRGERVAIERPQASDNPDFPLDISWVVVDELFYFDQSPWPSSADGSGYPLIRTGLTDWSIPAAADTDDDKISDAWEHAYFQTLEQNQADSDHDGRDNIDEYIAGTDPTDGDSYFNTTVQNTPDQFIITWEAMTGQVYNVYWTPSLTAAFQPLEIGITYPQNSYTDQVHSTESAGYYRVMVMRADYDLDGDGLPNEWEVQHAVSEATADVDNDGFSNLEEYIADTDPNKTMSYFSIQELNANTLSWTPAIGRTYSIYWTDDLGVPFTRIASELPDTQHSFTDELHADNPINYYRITVELDN